MNVNSWYLYIFIILKLFGNCILTNIISSLHKYGPDIPLDKKLENIEKMFIQSSIKRKIINNDAVCNLSNEKKKELCRMIFELPIYQKYGIHINKIAFYKANLPCIEKELFFSYGNDYHKTIRQKMYPCYGRHTIIRTSFIEDDYYNTFHVSAGFEKNSIGVYTYLHHDNNNKINLYDFVHNIDLSKLNNMIISDKEVVAELQLHRAIHVTKHMNVEKIYRREQQYLENDPVCDLPYEIKITLCGLIFEIPTFKNNYLLALNKSATYVLSMNCMTKPVHDANPSIILQKQLQDKQEMYPCHGKNRFSTRENLLSDNFVRKIFLSSGPRRHSLFVYCRVTLDNFEDRYHVVQFIENIDIMLLKATIITSKELVVESKMTYKIITDLIERYEKQYFTMLLNMIITNMNEDYIFNRMVDEGEKNINNIVETEKKRSQIKEAVAKHRVQILDTMKDTLKQIDTSKDMSHERMTLQELLYKGMIEDQQEKFFAINILRQNAGPQTYKRLLEKIQTEMISSKNISNLLRNKDSSSITNEMKNKLEQKVLEMRHIKIVERKRNLKLDNKVQNLINYMEQIILNKNLTQDIIKTKISNNENKAYQEKESKKAKKKKK